MAEKQENCRPIPAPRRLHIETQLNKANYENVTVVDIIDKNLNIKSENLQNNANYCDKVPNKSFLLPNHQLEDIDRVDDRLNQSTRLLSSTSILTETNDLHGPKTHNINDIDDDQQNDDDDGISIHLPIERNSSNECNSNDAIKPPAPVPRSRRQFFTNNNSTLEIQRTAYENVELQRTERMNSGDFKILMAETNQDHNKSRSNPFLKNESLVDTSRMMTTTTPIPAKNEDSLEEQPSSFLERSKESNEEESLEGRKYHLPSPGYVSNDEAVSDDHGAFDPVILRQSSCRDNETSSNDNTILWTLGAASRLLTESIGERVAVKAKDAKHKFDRNIRNSSGILNNLGTETTQRLRKLSDNFHLGKKEKNCKDFALDNNENQQEQQERPQTMPSMNDQLFQNISFSSPLESACKELEINGTTYQVPQHIRPVRSELDLQTNNNSNNNNNSNSNNNEDVIRINDGNVAKNQAYLRDEVLNTIVTTPKVMERLSFDSNDEFRDNDRISVSLPMPNIPAPILNINNVKVPELPVRRPPRHENYEDIQLRQKSELIAENNDRERDSMDGSTSLRVTLDSMDLNERKNEEIELESKIVTGVKKPLLVLRERDRSNTKKNCTYSNKGAERSESWEYYEERIESDEKQTDIEQSQQNNHHRQSDESLKSDESMEPIYVNREVTYGHVCTMITSNKDLMVPQKTSKDKEERYKHLGEGEMMIMTTEKEEKNKDEEMRNCDEMAGASAIVLDDIVTNSKKSMPTELIQEFDPLLTKKLSTLENTDKSNQLLLLECLLEDDVYGTIRNIDHHQVKQYDDNCSTTTSEEDNYHPMCSNQMSVNNASTNSLSDKIGNKLNGSCSSEIHIIHQNTALHTESNENNILTASAQDIKELKDQDEARVRPFLIRFASENRTKTRGMELSNVVPSSKGPSNRTKWFTSAEKKDQNQIQNVFSDVKRVNPFCNSNTSSNVSSSSNGNNEKPPSYQEAVRHHHCLDTEKERCGSVESLPTSKNEFKSSRKSSRFMDKLNVLSNVKAHVDAITRKVSFNHSNHNKSSSMVKVTLQMVPRPILSPLLTRHEGPLIRFPSGMVEDILKEMQNRKAILRDRQFQTYQDQEMKTLKEVIPLEHITTIQLVSNSRVSVSATHFHCFEITTAVPKYYSGSAGASNGDRHSSLSHTHHQLSNPNIIMTSKNCGNVKHIRTSHLYGISKETERDIWMQKLLESVSSSIPNKYICHYYRAGWCYLKNSISSDWDGAWLVLHKSHRRLIFVTESLGNVEKIDLRKARCIVLKDCDESIRNLHVENGPILMIDAPPYSVYMIMSSSRETKIWRHIISEVAHNNGFNLADQQLNKFDVPVIVDKCINFVYIHGSMSEGIYRKSGSENSITKLMAAFRTDAFNVEITRNEYNEHDVANVLKRFMRDLPERLLGKLSESFMSVTELKSTNQKISMYQELLARLNTIERETLKRLVGHLAFISTQSASNKMSIQNLTMIWGPTLLQGQKNDELIYSQRESDVLTDFIKLYKNLFPLSAEDIRKEQLMLDCLKKYYAAAETLKDSIKKSGDLKVWIILNSNPENTEEEKQQVNVTISPTKTAYEICAELAPKMQLATHQVTLHEYILNGSLQRPLHHDTKVFDVILNWSYWTDDDRKNNYLTVKPINLLNDLQRAVKKMPIMTRNNELKFADNRTKSFKSYQCELRDRKIIISRLDKNERSTIIKEIFLCNTTAYLGSEKKRDVTWSWAITLIENNQTQILRTRESPYIGHVIAGNEWYQRTYWFSSIWYSLYGESILPPAEILIN